MNVQDDKLTFDSLSDLAQWLDVTPRLSGAGHSSTNTHASYSWDLGVSYDETMKIAAKGGYWMEGAAMVRNGVARAAEMSKQSQAPAIENSVAGFLPDVPAYLAGVPDNMMAMAETGIVAVSPIISIGVPNASGGVGGESIMNRGIAIVTLVDALESQGYRVEVHTALGCKGFNDQTLCDATVIIKQANEPWNPNSMAFGMGHPALIRRLGFAVRERCEGSVNCTRRGYGIGALIDNGRFTVPVPYLEHNMGLTDALKHVERQAQAAGLDVTLLDK